MLKKTITYTDYNGDVRTEDFYFNLTRAEIVELEVSEEGGYAEQLQKIGESSNAKAIMAAFKDLILKAYGVRSDDGRRFIKSPQLSEEFVQTEAYSKLFFELVTDADQAVRFAKGVLPADLEVAPPVISQARHVEAVVSSGGMGTIQTVDDGSKTVVVKRSKDISEMTLEELREAIEKREG